MVSNWLFCVVPFTWATSLRVSIKPFDAKASGDLLACFQEGAPNSLPPLKDYPRSQVQIFVDQLRFPLAGLHPLPLFNLLRNPEQF